MKSFMFFFLMVGLGKSGARHFSAKEPLWALWGLFLNFMAALMVLTFSFNFQVRR